MINKILYALQANMTTPTPWGWFHLLCLGVTAAVIVLLYIHKDEHSEKQLKFVIGVYSIIALLLELTKQIIWSFNYDTVTQIVTWDYQWYSAPFQLCTTPIYVCLFCLFLDDGKVRKSLLSYVSFTTILGSITTVFLPESCFTEDILVNIHTTWMHYGSLVVSIYLLFTGEVELSLDNLCHGLYVFVMFVGLATLLNVGVYQSGVLNGETFNMFYISPYFVSSLPVFDTIQQSVPYVVYLLTYVVALSLGSLIVFAVAKVLKLAFSDSNDNAVIRDRLIARLLHR